MQSWKKTINLLQCFCGGDIYIVSDEVKCSLCEKKFGKTNSLVFMYAEADKSEETITSNSDGLIAKIKYFFKKFPRLYFFIAYILGGRQVNTTAQKFVNRISVDKVIVNLGSGTKSLGQNVINVDFSPFSIVDVVAKAEELPFKDNSVDSIICDNVLEHIKNPEKVVMEMRRVLKHGGTVYIGVPFIIQYHSSPDDFYRWTYEGVRELMSEFEETELKIACGPTSAMTTILSEWLALVLSFNIGFLYNIFIIIFTIVFAPLRLLDDIFSHYNKAKNIAFGFYFIGKKSE